MKALYQKIKAISGKPYGNYKQLATKKWDFGDFELEFLHVQGDPYAPASRILCSAKLETLNWAQEFHNSAAKRKAFTDFLHRTLKKCLAERFANQKPPISIGELGPEILMRNSVWVKDGSVEVCLQVSLPGAGRVIEGEAALDILTSALPDILASSLYAGRENEAGAKEALHTLEVHDELEAKLEPLGLAAFIPNGAVLPRESGISEKPLLGAVKFCSPKELEVSIQAGGELVTGMGVPKGITLITGGAYHGKSTLLEALEKAAYPHVQGDGREWVVVQKGAVKVRSEDGRSVRRTDISAMVRNLPGGKSTSAFDTASASGSTSEAANLMEALEFGAKTILIDEDASAVNFLIRDERMRKLIGNEREPLIPLIDRIREFKARGVSFIIVAGACGDYLEVADQVILMADYKAECKAAEAGNFDSARREPPELEAANYSEASRNFNAFTAELKPSVKPLSAQERQVKVKLNGEALQIGFLTADLSRLSQFPDAESKIGAGLLLLNLLQNPEDKPALEALLGKIERVEQAGFKALPQGMNRSASLPRLQEIAAALLRLRDYKQGR